VSHVVYTSLTNPDEGNPIGFAVDHRETEALIKQTGFPTRSCATAFTPISCCRAGSRRLAR